MTDQFCYIHVRGQAPGKRIGIVEYLDSGYYATDLDQTSFTSELVEEAVTAANQRLGVPPAVRDAMEIGSMRGWRAPGARAALKHFGVPQIEEV